MVMNKAQAVKTLLFVLFVIGGFELIWFNPKTETAEYRDLVSVHQAKKSIQHKIIKYKRCGNHESHIRS